MLSALTSFVETLLISLGLVQPVLPPVPVDIPTHEQVLSQAIASTTPLPISAAVHRTEAATGTLKLAFKDVGLPYIHGVTEELARHLCGLVFGDTCVWGDRLITERPHYLYGTSGTQPMIAIHSPRSGVSISYGTIVPIVFSDPGPRGRYRAYLSHVDLLGEINEVHEADIVASSYDGEQTTLSWDGNELLVNESGDEQIVQLRPGHYALTVVNVDTGVEGGIPGFVVTSDDGHGQPVSTSQLLKPYAANTPLVRSYWDGRGIFFDGKEDIDTLRITGKRSDVMIYRGIDMPQRGELSVLVLFRRTDNAVIVITNVEKIAFDDRTEDVSDIIRTLAPTQ